MSFYIMIVTDQPLSFEDASTRRECSFQCFSCDQDEESGSGGARQMCAYEYMIYLVQKGKEKKRKKILGFLNGEHFCPESTEICVLRHKYE